MRRRGDPTSNSRGTPLTTIYSISGLIKTTRAGDQHL